MTMPPEEIQVRCPGCQTMYQDWWRPSVNLNLDDFDAKYLEQCSTATCPKCGLKVALGTLVVQDGVFQVQEHTAQAWKGRPPRLFELAYACRLYRDFTDYDDALAHLRKETAPAVDLGSQTHRKAVLRWLNAWGCRQFSIEHHPLASRSLERWARESLDLLPDVTVCLAALSAEGLDHAMLAYDRLTQAGACIRRRGTTDHRVTFGPTGAAKTLYALRPEAFPPWDEPIREAFECDGSAASYRGLS